MGTFYSRAINKDVSFSTQIKRTQGVKTRHTHKEDLETHCCRQPLRPHNGDRLSLWSYTARTQEEAKLIMNL